MSVDERGRVAAENLLRRVSGDLDAQAMLRSVRRTRTRRRVAMLLPAAAAAVALAVAFQVPRGNNAEGPSHPSPSPSSPSPSFVPDDHANGALLGYGNPQLAGPGDLHLPPIDQGSSLTWSPDGSQLASVDHGILITDVSSGNTRALPCNGCTAVAWSPDGGTFAAVDAGSTDLVLIDATSGGIRDVGLNGFSAVNNPMWAPTGAQVGFVGNHGRDDQALYTVDLDGGGLQTVVAGPINSHAVRVAAASWSWANNRIAYILTTPAGQGWGGPIEQGVFSVRPDASERAELGPLPEDRTGGWVPNIAWAPDGSTIAVYTLGHPHESKRLLGDGSEVRLHFLPGSGPFAWQPRQHGPQAP